MKTEIIKLTPPHGEIKGRGNFYSALPEQDE